MTRRARCGNTQKHHKVPGDATPWEEWAVKTPEQKQSRNKTERQEDLNIVKHHNSEKDGISSSSCNSDVAKVSKDVRIAEQKKKRKESYIEMHRKRREQLGLLLLPPNVERRLYKIKKRLREQNAPGYVIKETIRKERRKEELKFRKTLKPCFCCRKIGHQFADCPLRSDVVKQESGKCFKCGSSEHTSYKCPSKIEGFPLAKCFICKESGHISKDCPKNSRGIYPKGGRCYLCGNVNHLKIDCPSLKKKSNDEQEIFIDTVKEGISIDAEVKEEKTEESKLSTEFKKPKIVKF